MGVMTLAYELGRTEEEILAMKPDEFARWVAFFRIKFPPKKRSR